LTRETRVPPRNSKINPDGSFQTGRASCNTNAATTYARSEKVCLVDSFLLRVEQFIAQMEALDQANHHAVFAGLWLRWVFSFFD
jgi:hypothetical protein